MFNIIFLLPLLGFRIDLLKCNQVTFSGPDLYTGAESCRAFMSKDCSFFLFFLKYLLFLS